MEEGATAHGREQPHGEGGNSMSKGINNAGEEVTARGKSNSRLEQHHLTGAHGQQKAGTWAAIATYLDAAVTEWKYGEIISSTPSACN